MRLPCLEWLCIPENSILLKKTQEASDFPDPLSLYALYRVILYKDPMNKMIEYPFIPFRGRTGEEYVLSTGDERVERKDYAFWISTLVRFLGGPALVTYDSDTERTVQLTHFGTYIFPHLMNTFVELYRQNDSLREAVATYRPPSASKERGKSQKNFSPLS